MDNVCDFNAAGNLAMKIEEDVWQELLAHLHEELHLRREFLRPQMIQGGHFNGRPYVNTRRAAELWSGHDLPLGTYLLKFGSLKYLTRRSRNQRGLAMISEWGLNS